MRLLRESKASVAILTSFVLTLRCLLPSMLKGLRTSIVGKIISSSACCGNVTQIMTRYLHFIVNSRDSWHSIVFIQHQAKKELLFWRDNLRNLNGVSFWSTPFVPSKIVFSDASSTGCAAFIQSSSLIFHRNWSATESLKSSTWRELATVRYSLEAFNSNLAGHRVRWNTDNQNVVRIVQVDSMIEELQELTLDIFLFASSHNIRLDLTWIPLDQNSEADRFSKVVDIDNYSVHDDVFIHLDRLWGPHSIDSFASSYNAKLPRFNLRFLQSGTEVVDAFSQDWSCDNNWIVPPITVVGKVQYRSKVSYHLSSRFSRYESRFSRDVSRFSRAASRFSRESLKRLVWDILRVRNRLRDTIALLFVVKLMEPSNIKYGSIVCSIHIQQR